MDARAWRRDTIDDPSRWYVRLPDELTPSSVRPVVDALEQGRGFVIVADPGGDLTDEQRTQRYWRLGEALGRPVTQNVQGTLLYDVRDTGQDVYSGARFSVTNAESSFHTDASFIDGVVDYVGLLCLRGARSGGVSQVVSGRSALEELARHPEALAVLRRPFHVDRRGGVRPGEGPTAPVPVLSEERGGPCFRYLRHWIEAGHDKAGQPLSGEQRAALDALDEVLGDPALRAEFVLRPGEVFLVNNRWVLHNRTAFEDFTEPERKRHLVRLWVARADGGTA